MRFHLTTIVVIVLQQINRIFTQGIPISPCPKLFQYRFDGIEWFGMLSVRNPDFHAALHIKVTLTIRGKPTTSYFGEIELLSRGQYYTDAPVLYKVKFPKTHFPPKLQQVTVNNNVICAGHSDYSPFITQIQLEHIRKFTFITNEEPSDKPPELTQYSASFMGDEEEDDDIDFMQSDTKFSGEHIPVAQADITSKYSELLNICGKTAVNIHPRTSFILPSPTTRNIGNTKLHADVHGTYIPIGGDRIVATTDENNKQNATDDEPTTPLVVASETLPILLPNTPARIKNLTSSTTETVLSRGDWPWLAAIYVNNLTSLVYQCAGTLVSWRIIVSSAHCFHLRKHQYKANEILVFLGRHNLRSWNEEHSIAAPVSDIFVHPDFDVSLGTYDADIAVVVLKHKVRFNMYIRPACLWSGESQIKDIIGERGYIVGWGVLNSNSNNHSKDELPTITALPRIIEVPIVSEEVCFASNPGLFTLTSNRTFCAGLLSTTRSTILRAVEKPKLLGPCTGDSGAGLLLRRSSRWMLRGIVSATLPSKHNKCIIDQYVVYADVAKFLDWVLAFTI